MAAATSGMRWISALSKTMAVTTGYLPERCDGDIAVTLSPARPLAARRPSLAPAAQRPQKPGEPALPYRCHARLGVPGARGRLRVPGGRRGVAGGEPVIEVVERHDPFPVGQP